MCLTDLENLHSKVLKMSCYEFEMWLEEYQVASNEASNEAYDEGYSFGYRAGVNEGQSYE